MVTFQGYHTGKCKHRMLLQLTGEGSIPYWSWRKMNVSSRAAVVLTIQFNFQKQLAASKKKEKRP